VLTEAEEKEAAALIAEHWDKGNQLHALPEQLRPMTRSEGYRIQAHLEAMSARPLFGWKIAATSDGGQRHIGVDGPLAGRLLADRVLTDGEMPSLAGNHMRVAEPEFAFRMAKTFAPRDQPYDRDETIAAVETLHLAIELPDSRFTDFAKVGAPQLIADNACAHQFLLSPALADDWRALDLSRQKVSIAAADKVIHKGSGSAVLGDPVIALLWLVNELSSLGVTLVEGQVVTTGTTTVPLPIEPGDQIVADFDQFGELQLTIAS
jgi:2-keto-4-pentenoate hydratase